MQYLKKNHRPPEHWNDWFNRPAENPDYRLAVKNERVFKTLCDEQNGLCAYCQTILDSSPTKRSIEHVIPYDYNKALSQNYYNLVAVCSRTGSKNYPGNYCETHRGNKLLLPLIFHEHFQCNQDGEHRFFDANVQGTILVKKNATKEVADAADSYIKTLNLNHHDLETERRRAYDGIKKAQGAKPAKDYWQAQLGRLLVNRKQPFRQYLMIMSWKNIVSN